MLFSQKTVDRFYIIALAVIAIMFCVLVFIMKYKTTEGKLAIWLPMDADEMQASIINPVLDRIMVSMEWDAGAGKTKLMIGSTPVEGLSKLEEIIQNDVCCLKKAGRQINDSPITTVYAIDAGYVYNIVPVVINAAPNVPCQDVVNVINICKKLDIAVMFVYRYTPPDDPDDPDDCFPY